MRRHLWAVLICAMVASSGVGHAGPSAPQPALGQAGLHLVHHGRCPGPRAMRRALGQVFHLQRGHGAWQLRIRRGRRAEPLTLSLRDPRGTLSLRRQLPADDCDTLVGAVVIILEAHFLQLALPQRLDPRRPKGPGPTSKPASRPSSQPASAPTRAKGPPRHLMLALGGGVSGSPTPGLLSAVGQLSIGLQPLSLPILVRANLSLEHPTQQQVASDRVDLRQAGARIELALRLRRRSLWLQPAAGAGVTVLMARALDLAGQPSTLRTKPVLTASLAGGLMLTQWLGATLELGAALSLTPDSYHVRPLGEVARSPRWTLVALLGLEWDHRW